MEKLRKHSTERKYCPQGHLFYKEIPECCDKFGGGHNKISTAQQDKFRMENMQD